MASDLKGRGNQLTNQSLVKERKIPDTGGHSDKGMLGPKILTIGFPGPAPSKGLMACWRVEQLLRKQEVWGLGLRLSGLYVIVFAAESVGTSALRHSPAFDARRNLNGMSSEDAVAKGSVE